MRKYAKFEFEQKDLIFVFQFTGVPIHIIRAEIIPRIPDPDNAGVGSIDHRKVIFGINLITIPFFI